MRGEVGLTYSSSSSPSSQVSMRLPSGSLLQGQYSLPFDLLICHHYIPPLVASGRVSGASGCVPLGAPLLRYPSGVPLGCTCLGCVYWGVPLECFWVALACLWRTSGVGLGLASRVSLWGRSGWGGELSIRDSRTHLWGRGTARWFGLGLVIGSPPSTGVVGVGVWGVGLVTPRSPAFLALSPVALYQGGAK